MCIIQVTCEAGGECNALDQLYRPVPVSTITTRGEGVIKPPEDNHNVNHCLRNVKLDKSYLITLNQYQ